MQKANEIKALQGNSAFSVGGNAMKSSVTVTLPSTYAEKVQMLADQSLRNKERNSIERKKQELLKTPLPEDRKPYVRTVQDDETYVGLIIGQYLYTEYMYCAKSVTMRLTFVRLFSN